MCGPILGMVGAVVQGIAGFQQAKTQAANYKAQELAAKRDAAIKREEGSYEGERRVERGKQLIGRQIAAYGSSGIAPSTGTPLAVVTSTGADIGLDIAASRWGYAREIENDIYRSKVANMNASSANAAAPLAFIAPVINAGATFFRSGFGS